MVRDRGSSRLVFRVDGEPPYYEETTFCKPEAGDPQTLRCRAPDLAFLRAGLGDGDDRLRASLPTA